MTIAVGDKLPGATLTRVGEKGPEQVALADVVKGRKVAIFGLPGAYTGTCSTAHVPSFMRVRGKLAEKGVDEVICVSVNDAFVMKAWGESTGATAAGITMLADADSSLTKALGLNFSAPAIGFIDRSKRYSLLAVDGVVTQLNLEESPGACEISAGETLLAQL